MKQKAQEKGKAIVKMMMKRSIVLPDSLQATRSAGDVAAPEAVVGEHRDRTKTAWNSRHKWRDHLLPKALLHCWKKKRNLYGD